MNRFIVCLVAASFAVVASAQSNTNFQCPNDKSGMYQDPVQCDKFYECDDGVATEKLCPDGLVFDEKITRRKSKCDQPFNVDCEDRIELQPPKGTNEKCPRKNGFFAHPNPAICNVFYNCENDEATEVTCAAGLYFDEYTGTCIWKADSTREGCSDEATPADEDGFSCPATHTKSVDTNGQVVDHPKFPHPTDCQKFYVCLNGVDRRSLGCSAGEVYNEQTQRCDAPENVPGCEDWYKESEEESNKPASKKSRK